MTALLSIAGTADSTIPSPREQKRTGRLVRPSARYIGPGVRDPRDISGFDALRAPDAP